MSRKILILLLLAIVLLSIKISRADFKIGTYTWEHGFSNGSGGAKAFGGGYSHLDLSWTWSIEEGHTKIQRDWTTAANCLDVNPSQYAGHSGIQYANYAVKKYYPSLWSRIKAHSDAGRYDAGELSWNEGYWKLGGDEFYLRNFYISYRFCMDNFGYAPLVASEYDLDGPMWSQPKMQNHVTGRWTANPNGIGFMNRSTYAEWGMKEPYGICNGADVDSNTCGFKFTSDDGSMVLVGQGGEVRQVFSGATSPALLREEVRQALARH